jgi:hypothetical protein
MARPKKTIVEEPKEVVTETLDLTPTETPNVSSPLEPTIIDVKPIILKGKTLDSIDKVKLAKKGGKIIAMAVERGLAERMCKENPNLEIL